MSKGDEKLNKNFMTEEDKIKVTEQDYIHHVENLKMFMKYQEMFFESFLKIKLSFLSFVGIIVAVVLANKEKFSQNFLEILIFSSILSFLLITVELLHNFIDRTKVIKKQHRRTVLAKIRHIGNLRSDFSDYGSRAEDLLMQENKIEQQMLNKESISDIIKYQGSKLSWFLFIIWLLSIISVPILFLLEILGKL